VGHCLEHARRVNPDMAILRLSARTGDGMEAWLDWVRREQRAVLAQQASYLETHLATTRIRLTLRGG